MPDSASGEPPASPGRACGLFAATVGTGPAVHGPLYRQLKRNLEDAIRNHVVAADEALPPERELAEELNVSRVTLRKAIDGLVDEGLLVRRRGSGTFVSHRVEKSFSKLASFSDEMRSRGRTPRSELLSCTCGAVSPEEALGLGVSPDTNVIRLQRLRYADSNLMALEYATVPAACLDREDIGDSLYAALDRRGFRPVRALQRLRVIALAPPQAGHLGVGAGDPGLLIERRSFAANGQTCELTQSYYRADTYDVVAELTALPDKTNAPRQTGAVFSGDA